MKSILIYILSGFVFLTPGFITNNNLLDGKVFYGKAVEVTSEDNNRMPVLRDEVIVFSNGKVSCELFKNFTIKETEYTAEIDGRRAIAVEVITFTSTFTSQINGTEVLVEFSGEVFAGEKLSAGMKINYPGKKTEEYSVVGESR